MKSFHDWFTEQGKNAPVGAPAPGKREVVTVRSMLVSCQHCGKLARIYHDEWEAGDSGWYLAEWGDTSGLCGGGIGCTP